MGAIGLWAITTVGDGEGAQVLWIARAGRFTLSSVFAVEIGIFWRGVKGRGEDVCAASAKSRGRIHVAESATNGFELLLAGLGVVDQPCDARGLANAEQS